RSRKCTFRKSQVAKIWSYFDNFASGTNNFDTEYMFCEPGRWTRSPTMTKAVPETDIAVGTIIAMHINFASRNQLIYTRRVRHPFHIKIFPESSGAQVKHSTPVLPDHINSALIVPCLCLCFEHIIPIESRKVLSTTN